MALKFIKRYSFPSTGGAFISDEIIDQVAMEKTVSAIHLIGDVLHTPTDVTAGAWKSDVRMAAFLKDIEVTVRSTARPFNVKGKDLDQFHYLLGGYQELETKAAVAASAMQHYYSFRIPTGFYPSQSTRPARTWFDRKKIDSFQLKLLSAAETDVLGTAITANVVNHHYCDLYLEYQDHTLEAGNKGSHLAFMEQIDAPTWTAGSTDNLLQVRLKKPHRKIVGVGVVTENDGILTSGLISNVQITAGDRLISPRTRTMAEVQKENLQRFLPTLSTVRPGVAYWTVDDQRNLTRARNTSHEGFDIQYDTVTPGGTTGSARWILFSAPASARA